MKSYGIYVVLLILAVLVATPALALVTEGVEVECAASSRFKAKKQVKQRAGQEAVRSYVLRANPGIDKKSLQTLVASHAAFVKGKTQQDFTYERGKGRGTYKVTLDDAAINRRLEEMGVGVQSGQKARVVFVIMEEPPTKASMDLILDPEASDGVKKLRGLGPFVTFYPDFQRAIRDEITRKANQEGLKLQWLEMTPGMERYKKAQDDPLLGVHFDFDREDFIIDQQLMQAVRDHFAAENGIVYRYRIDSLYFDQIKRVLKAKLSISLLDLTTNEVKSVGAQEYATTLIEKVPSIALRDGLADVAGRAASLLMNDAKKEGRRMASMALQRQKRGSAQPGKVTIQLSSKRMLYKLKKQLASRVAGATMKGNVLVVDLPSGTSPDDFVFGDLYEILENFGLNIPEDHVRIQGNQAMVRE
ncbi:MAG: hypothetical protein CSA21_02310 [Deltaproteobacteria bacterium]|nr:MAG: hypothetical protein CSA21_02310 [Deltaproteobacteria bacterium]